MRAAAGLLLLCAAVPAAAQGGVWETAAVPLGAPIKLAIDDVPPPATVIRIAPDRVTITLAIATPPRLVFSLPPLRFSMTSYASERTELTVRPADLAGPNHIDLRVRDRHGAVRLGIGRVATVEGYDVTPIIRAAGLSISAFEPRFAERFAARDRNPAWSRRHGSRGAFASHGLIAPDGAHAPAWSVELAYSFEGNRYRAGRPEASAGQTVISYAPIAARGQLGPGAPSDETMSELSRLFCLGPEQAQALSGRAAAAAVDLRHVGFDLDRSWTPLVGEGETAVFLAASAEGWTSATCTGTRRTERGETALALPDSYPTTSGVAHILFWR
jgi:hypothetical protein